MRRLPAMLALVLVAAGAAGCGAGEDASPAATAEPSATTAATVPQPTEAPAAVEEPRAAATDAAVAPAGRPVRADVSLARASRLRATDLPAGWTRRPVEGVAVAEAATSSAEEQGCGLRDETRTEAVPTVFQRKRAGHLLILTTGGSVFATVRKAAQGFEALYGDDAVLACVMRSAAATLTPAIEGEGTLVRAPLPPTCDVQRVAYSYTWRARRDDGRLVEITMGVAAYRHGRLLVALYMLGSGQPPLTKVQAQRLSHRLSTRTANAAEVDAQRAAGCALAAAS